jgi:hypothetical protein
VRDTLFVIQRVSRRQLLDLDVLESDLHRLRPDVDLERDDPVLVEIDEDTEIRTLTSIHVLGYVNRISFASVSKVNLARASKDSICVNAPDSRPGETR